MSFIISIIWILTILSLIEGQTLPEGGTERTTVCTGQFLRGSCPAKQVIAVKNVKFGTKLTSTCPLSSNATRCCEHAATDCFDPPYTGTAQQAACSGKSLCNDVGVGEADTSACGAAYPGLNHYLTMEYYCLPESRVGKSSSATFEETGEPLYIKNTDYPSPIRAAETNMSCSVETLSCTSRVDVYFVHFQLSDGGGACTDTQNLQIGDKGVTQTYTCSDNMGYTINQKLTSTSNYLIINLNNPDGITDGKFWIGFKATNDTVPLTVHCPADVQQMCMDCPQLNIISNGTVSTIEGLSTGKTANYSCEPEFELLGNKTRTCLENGKWSGQAPTCQIKVCSPLPDPEHGNVMATGESVGQTASYECDSGYSLNGTMSRICQGDRTWSGIQPTCVLIECPVLNNPPNGIVSIDGGSTVGKNATYKCNYGYELEGVESRTCQTNETWAGEQPVCTEIVCPALSNPDNGAVRTDNGSTADQTATYECNSGHSLSGDSSRTCQLNGTWSGDEPTCALIEACPALTSPENGRVSTDGNTIGSTATYTCSHGFIISNSNARVCQAGFTWSGTQPTCTKRKLGDPCTSEADCSDAIPESTCKNETCVCPEGSEVKGNLCVRSGESKPRGKDEIPVWVWVLIGVGGAILVVALCVAVKWCLQRRKDRQPKDDPDKFKMEFENTNNMKKDKSNAYDNDAYQGHVDQTGLTQFQQDIPYTNHKVVNKNSEHYSNRKMEHRLDKDSEQVMVVDNTLHADKDVQEYVPHHPIEPPNQDQSGLSTNKELQELANSDLSNRRTENAEDNRNPKKTEVLVNKTTIEPLVAKDFESVTMSENPKYDCKDDKEFNSIPQKHIELSGDKQNDSPKCETAEDQISSFDKSKDPVANSKDPIQTTEDGIKIPKDQISSIDEAKHPEAESKDPIQATEDEIKEAVNLDERFSEASELIKGVTSALFRSASIAKRDLVAKANLAGFSFDTTEDGEWSKGLISAAKAVLAAIFSMCNIANDMVDGNAREEKMKAATKEVKRATNALILAFHVEGYSESDSMQIFKAACAEVNKAAETLLNSASSKFNTGPDTQSVKKKSIELDKSEVQKAMKRIEAQETVMRKQKEYEEAVKAKELINEEQNKFQGETTEL